MNRHLAAERVCLVLPRAYGLNDRLPVRVRSPVICCSRVAGLVRGVMEPSGGMGTGMRQGGGEIWRESTLGSSMRDARWAAVRCAGVRVRIALHVVCRSRAGALGVLAAPSQIVGADGHTWKLMDAHACCVLLLRPDVHLWHMAEACSCIGWQRIRYRLMQRPTQQPSATAGVC